MKPNQTTVRLFSLSLFLLFLISLFVFGCGKNISPDRPANQEFDQLMEEMFISQMTDPMNVNFFIRNPEQYGITGLEVEPIDMTYASYEEYIADLKQLKTEVEAFTPDMLSRSQRLTYAIVLDYLNTELEAEPFFYYDRPLGSYLGYQAELPIILSEYHFYTKTDIEHYLDYLITTPDTFSNIAAFEKEKADKGFGMPDPILDGIISQIDTFLETHGSNLIAMFNKKTEAADFLTEQEKTTYRALNQQYLQEDFLPAYQNLRTKVLALKGKAVNTKGLAYFEKGKEYYQYLFQKATGTDMTPTEGYAYLEKRLEEGLAEMTDILRRHPDYAQKMFDEIIPQTAYDDLLNMYLLQTPHDFPSIGNVEVRIESIPEALEEFSSPAMYFISPIDAQTTEVIYINDTLFSDDPTYAALTLSHEGVPGHLLQHVTLKNSNLPNIRKVIDYNSYSEGWATYVEHFVSRYFTADADLLRVYELNNTLTYLIYCLADIGINDKGWTIGQLETFLSDYYSDLNEEQLEDIYYQLVEVPANFIEYYFSYYQILDLKKEFIDEAKHYQFENPDYEFHKFFLSVGPAPFPVIADQIDDYLNQYQ